MRFLKQFFEVHQIFFIVYYEFYLSIIIICKLKKIIILILKFNQ